MKDNSVPPESSNSQSVGSRVSLGVSLLLLLFGAMTFVFALTLVAGRMEPRDWLRNLYPAAAGLVNPYEIEGYFNPPWLLWILRPFTILPPRAAYVAWLLITIPLCIWSLKRLGASFLGCILALLTPFHRDVLFQGNVDALLLIGFAIAGSSPSFAALLILTKPQQIGMVLAAPRFHTWSVGAGLGLAAMASLAIQGNWVLEMSKTILERGPQMQPWNFSIFPLGLAAGLPLAYVGISRNDPYLLAASTPFLSPYVTGFTFFPVTSILMARLTTSLQLLSLGLSWLLYHFLAWREGAFLVSLLLVAIHLNDRSASRRSFT